MSEVQPEALVVRQAAGLAGRWARAFAQIFFAGALICGDLAHQHDLLPQAQTGSPSHADSKVFTSSFHEQFEQATSSYSGASPSGHRRHGPLPGHDGGGRRDGLHRDLQRRGPGTASRCTIAPGVKKRLIGKVNNALHAITKEYQIYQTNSLYCKSKADIMEAFAGSAKISKMSSAYGLKAVTPLDFNTGVDLSTKHGQDICDSLMDRYHPLFFFAEIDCRPWVLLQDNVNFLHRPHELQSWRDSVRPMVARTASWCLKQHNAGRYFLIENPDNSRLWAEPTIDELRQRTNAFEVTCHHGAYGATNSKGQIIRKTFRFLTNNQHMANALMRKLSPEELQQCVPLEGKEVTLSQEYSDGLVKEMLKAVRRTAQELQPARFAPRRAHQVLANFAYSEPEPDAAAWKPIMEQVKEFFTRTSLKTTLLNPQEILYQDIQRLIPWNINRLQLASTPITFRQPGHVPHTHRGAVLLYAGDETPTIISEDISQVHFPRGRFSGAVDVGSFFFGFPNTVQEPTPVLPPDQQVRLPPEPQQGEKFHGEVTFPGADGLDRNAKFAVSRLHRNLGHISGKELIKLFTLNGITSDVFMNLCKVIECETCNRAKGPSQPNPAAPPQFIGLFGDQVQMDIVYVRDLTSRNHIVLGIIDEATHLHVAIRIPSRKPADTFKAFRTAWITPFGALLILRTDPDGSWGGEFAEQLDAIGCFFDPVPPEAHHRIGSIKRHNHLLRIIIEKLVESQGCVTEEHFDNIIAAATFAKNSGTWSSGRPPYVAAFGRIPRVGLDFINDPHSLTAGGTLGEAQQQAALLRAEAMKTIAETSASAAFRRAILRKTNNENTDNLELGALVAYWRWTVRSHRKRGGYRMARYIGRDPDRSLWVQTGTNTV